MKGSSVKIEFCNVFIRDSARNFSLGGVSRIFPCFYRFLKVKMVTLYVGVKSTRQFGGGDTSIGESGRIPGFY